MYLFKSPPRALLLFSQYVVYSLSSDLLFCKSMNYSPARLLCPWDFPSKNTGVGCHSLLQGIFSTQGLNPFLLCSIHYIQRKKGSWCIITQLLPLSYILCSIPCKFLPFLKTHYNLVCHHSCFRVTNVNIVSFKELMFGHQGVMFQNQR